MEEADVQKLIMDLLDQHMSNIVVEEDADGIVPVFVHFFKKELKLCCPFDDDETYEFLRSYPQAHLRLGTVIKNMKKRADRDDLVLSYLYSDGDGYSAGVICLARALMPCNAPGGDA